MDPLKLIILGLYNVFLTMNFSSLQINNIIMFSLKQTCFCCDKEEILTYQGVTDLMALIHEFQYL